MNPVNQKEDISDKATDQYIKYSFGTASSVKFSAKRLNNIEYRRISFGDLGWWFPCARVFPLIGVKPQALEPVFNTQKNMIKHRFPRKFILFGLKKNQYKVVEVELSEIIKNYEQLGNFWLAHKPFKDLAEIIGKPVEVFRENGSNGEHYHLFTAHPNGEIVLV